LSNSINALLEIRIPEGTADCIPFASARKIDSVGIDPRNEPFLSMIEPNAAPNAQAAERIAVWAIRLFALLAAAVAAYLLVVSLSQKGLPIGCGQGEGCDQVLRSRWSSLFGAPVGALALAAYLAAFAATFFVNTSRSTSAWRILALVAASVFVAALWFAGLQLFVLQAICPWCMADHVLGLSMSAAVAWALVSRSLLNPGASTLPRAWPCAVLGVALAGIMIALQATIGAGSSVVRLPAGQNGDSGPGPTRQVAVLNGKLMLDVHELPTLGDADAPKLIVLMFDYCCPHCRATHGYLIDGMPSYPGQYSLVLLPMPLDAKCNQAIDETEPRFKESCDLARLALAVWRAKPEAFPAFDAWLYEPEQPRTLAEAQSRATELVGAESLDSALRDPWIDESIATNVKAYGESGVDTLPLLLSSEMDGVVGRPESAKELFQILERDLKLKPSPP
jgi:uncharacterized membrane protein/protein-disulfide isomerase